ncbi:unnamed protein product [Urochloa decumbens]|uniref:Protein kinase domain-containing protein n=1 Tax=Urochloa decumbens TaxID=240449 RepID=A0ABC9CUT1_9POAL
MGTLVLALLAAPFMAAAVVKRGGRNCSAGCGGFEILPPYPFGVGQECSLPGFNLSCPSNSSYLLGKPSIQVDFDNQGVNDYSPFPTIRTSIEYLVKMAHGDHNYSVYWEAPGRPFAISDSSNMSLFVVGCGVKASLFVGDSGVEVGRCSAACVEDELMESLPRDMCIGIGCCSINITVNLRAFTLNISHIGQSVRLLKKAIAFVTDNNRDAFLFRPLDLLELELEQEFTDYGTGYYATLSWAIPYQPDHKGAMEDGTSYACVSNNSKYYKAPIGGYVCNCSEGFFGNPYVINGCVGEARAPVYDFVQPKANCPTSCGNVTFEFPFGTEIGCFAELQLYLTCNPGPSPPILQMSDGSVVTGISIDKGTLSVLKLGDPGHLLADVDAPLFSSTGEWGVTIKHKQVGYRCKCSPGFERNPYLKDGCTDIDECLQPDKYICNGICQNTFGSYTCTRCPHGTDFNDVTRKCRPSTIILGVTIGLSSGGGILFVAAVTAILTRRWKKSVQKQLRKRYFRRNKGILLEQLISSDQSASDGTKIFSLEELEKATNNFDHARVVGRGGHGTVYKGILTDQRVVAIKRSKLEVNAEIEQFINEVSILSHINHRNVVKLHGCCLEAEVPLLVYEFISNGTLYDLLHCEQNGILLPLSWEERLRIAIEVAGALTYLHSAASMSILHRDVKCMNILLNESYTAKVSDFGASRFIPIDQTHLVTAVQGTFGYLDPEYYHTGQLNEKSDVYSFGVILLELLIRKKPIFENENGEKQNLSNYFLWALGERPLEEIVDEQILGEASEEAIMGMAQLAQECLSLTRGERPTMKDVEMRLQMLRARNAAASGPKRGEEMTHACSEVARVNGISGAIPVSIGHHGTRQYSLEQEFVSSARVPR